MLRGTDGEEMRTMDGSSSHGKAKCPTLISATGIIWVTVGGLELLHMLAWFMLMGEDRIVGIPVACLPSGPAAGCTGLGGLPYLIAGYRTLAGKASDTQGYGAGSIALGLLQLFASMAYGLAGMNAQNGRIPGVLFTLAALMGLFGTALAVAGVFALASRSAYGKWHRSRRVAKILSRNENED